MRLAITREVYPHRPQSPERALLLSVLIQALRDLRARDEQIMTEARQWFTSRGCAWVCDLLDLPMERVQAMAQAILNGQTDAPQPLA